MTSSVPCDLAILGGGPGGFDAACEAASQGLSVALVEARELGGTCLNRGCIPTKLFLGGTDCAASLEAQQRQRLASGSIAFDLSAMQARKAKLLAGNRKAMQQRLDKAGVALVRGRGTLTGTNEMSVEGPDGSAAIAFKRLVLATGSRPVHPGVMRPDGQAVLDSDAVLELAEAPGSTVIVGGGAIGLEMGRILARLGTEITVVEALDRLAPGDDPEVSKLLAQAAKRQGWTLRLGARVASLSTVNGKARLELDGGEIIQADKALVAVGRRAASDGLGLEAAGADVDRRGFVAVDDCLMASDTVYAVGDVNGRTMLAHAASHQGRWVARHAAGKETGPYAPPAAPWCIYGDPETMRVGALPYELTGEVAVSRAALAANPMAQASGSPQGLVKVVWQDGRVRGVMAAGFGASHLVTLAAVAVAQAWTRADAEQVMWAHPTLDESLAQALAATPEPVS